MADIGEVQAHGLADGNLAEGHAQLLGQALRIGLCAASGAKAGHGHGHDASSSKTQPIEGAHAYQQGKRGIKAAGKAYDRVLGRRICQARGQANRLQVEDGLATLRQVAVVRGNKRRTRRHSQGFKR